MVTREEEKLHVCVIMSMFIHRFQLWGNRIKYEATNILRLEKFVISMEH